MILSEIDTFAEFRRFQLVIELRIRNEIFSVMSVSAIDSAGQMPGYLELENAGEV